MNLGPIGTQGERLAISRDGLGQPAGAVLALGQGRESCPFGGLGGRLARFGHWFCPDGRARAIRSKTSGHSPSVVWRKSRIVGYHGESSRSSSQRQSGENCSASQTGAPRAPAKCAIAVVRGHHQVEIADHGRGVHERTGHFIQPAGKIKDRKIDRCDLLRSEALLQADQPHAGQAGQRRKLGQRNRTPTIRGDNRASLARRCRS